MTQVTLLLGAQGFVSGILDLTDCRAPDGVPESKPPWHSLFTPFQQPSLPAVAGRFRETVKAIFRELEKPQQ
jgi:hypothetical protein